MEFKNKEVADLVEVMEKHMLAFEERRAGPTWRNILIAAVSVFTEDRPAVFARFGGGKQVQVAAGPHPKITRNKKREDVPCDGCPQGNAIHSSNLGSKVITPAPKTRKQEVIPGSEKEGAFTSIKDIMERFDGSAGAIRAFAQVQDITIPANVKKAETLAKYLLEGLNAKTKKNEHLDRTAQPSPSIRHPDGSTRKDVRKLLRLQNREG